MFNFVAVKENFTQMKEIVLLASRLGVSFVNITPVNVGSITTAATDNYRLFYTEDFRRALQQAFAISRSPGNVELTIWDVKKKNEFKKCHIVDMRPIELDFDIALN